jgi:hypothetical protein
MWRYAGRVWRRGRLSETGGDGEERLWFAEGQAAVGEGVADRRWAVVGGRRRRFAEGQAAGVGAADRRWAEMGRKGGGMRRIRRRREERAADRRWAGRERKGGDLRGAGCRGFYAPCCGNVFLQGTRGRAHKKGGVEDLGKLRNGAIAKWSNFDLFDLRVKVQSLLLYVIPFLRVQFCCLMKNDIRNDIIFFDIQ